MAGEVTDIEHPATMTAQLAGGSADAKKLKWAYTEPDKGAKPQPLASSTITVVEVSLKT